MDAGRCRYGWVALSLSLVVLWGCGPSGDRRPLRGRVEIDGVAVEQGSISLLPAEGNPGPAANGVIVDGAYRFTTETGPRAGPHRVLIDVESPPGGQDASGAGNTRDVKRTGARAERARPPGAGAGQATKLHWEIEFTVPEDGAPRKDFDLRG